MRKGEIVEVGWHEELLRREGGLYAHLCSLASDQARAPAWIGARARRRSRPSLPRRVQLPRYRVAIGSSFPPR
jgi:hypothetical protein